MAMKPFTPEEAREIVEAVQKPVVFLGMASDWPALHWNAEHLSETLGQKAVRFRIGKKQDNKSPFRDSPLSEHWAYADYKYIAMLFEDKASMFEIAPRWWVSPAVCGQREVLDWQPRVIGSLSGRPRSKGHDFGYPGRNGRESTLWIGTAGASTPCHQDSYGCNLVLQVQGRKRWHLFPPEDTGCLYPTRIPYEESSVFSRVSVVSPDHCRFPAFSRARAHVVTLEPGQVLFVPRHWWHYVESVDPITVSINSWIEMEVDDEERVGEALTRTIVCALKTTPSSDNTDDWLNPTEEKVTSHDENLQYLNLAVQACVEKQRRLPNKPLPPANPGRAQLGKRDSEGQSKCTAGLAGDSQHPTITNPFGPHLVPVPLKSEQLQQSKEPRLKSCSSTDSIGEPSHRCSQERVYSPGTGGDKGEDMGGEECSSSPQNIPISTNDLLECLVHPEVIAMVTKLLMSRHSVQGCT
ncbi:hypothetical protein JZ751_029086 [Albula glossodonta]|uniref:JmjC domain-containing protein n=1 Tax=Albula glossodonta TaxID=121402 RepID=A0A8T2P944_9TELE|nr:hypothetical protein JZ751_029086 [Albula glossodonta]